jgi:hypothetical protein
MMLAELAAQSHNVAVMKKSKLAVDDLRAVLEAASPTSKLGRWLSAHHVEFAQLLKTHRPHWQALAVKFAEEGLISVPPAFWGAVDNPECRRVRKRAGEAARQVWQRVKCKPAQVSRGASPSPSLPATRRRQSAAAASRYPLPNGSEDDEFRPARPRNV